MSDEKHTAKAALLKSGWRKERGGWVHSDWNDEFVTAAEKRATARTDSAVTDRRAAVEAVMDLLDLRDQYPDKTETVVMMSYGSTHEETIITSYGYEMLLRDLKLLRSVQQSDAALKRIRAAIRTAGKGA